MARAQQGPLFEGVCDFVLFGEGFFLPFGRVHSLNEEKRQIKNV